ncbi:hypothetical protein AVU18_gp078 [Citrobacter phage IME-CF2]|jgi:hypothetical protein|uniref:Uncharacterized protein n=1 Tax=Citrobacter phage IME-CF2 TaxID=1673887 RepID=A0A0K0QT48_9CAUD|nr:hypothetical protein AVU18_gp078 [Citrobacter phage IME-CF2]AKR15924.1 hypothetical protein [Citrobacter phage IME-CF2]
MTYNDLLAGFPGADAKYNLLKEYAEGSNPGVVWVEVRCGEYYNCFMWDRSFSYCLFAVKYSSDLLDSQREMLKENNPAFYAFAESIRGVFGH